MQRGEDRSYPELLALNIMKLKMLANAKYNTWPGSNRAHTDIRFVVQSGGQVVSAPASSKESFHVSSLTHVSPGFAKVEYRGNLPSKFPDLGIVVE